MLCRRYHLSYVRCCPSVELPNAIEIHVGIDVDLVRVVLEFSNLVNTAKFFEDKCIGDRVSNTCIIA